MRVFRQSLIDRVNLAVMQAPGIMTTVEGLADAPGYEESFLIELGLRSSDLRRLEVYGFAKRGYVRNKRGHSPKWVLIDPTKGRVEAGHDQTSGSPGSVERNPATPTLPQEELVPRVG